MSDVPAKNSESVSSEDENTEQFTANIDSEGRFKDFGWVVKKIDLLERQMAKILDTLEAITDGTR